MNNTLLNSAKSLLRRHVLAGSIAAALCVTSAASAQTVLEFYGSITSAGPASNRISSLTGLSSYGTHNYFSTIPFSSSGTVTMETTHAFLNVSGSEDDTWLSLYKNAFDPASALTNAVNYDDDSGGGNYLSLLTQNVAAGEKYVLVVTTYEPSSTGPYTLRMSGPNEIDLEGTYNGSLIIRSGTFGGNGTITGFLLNYGILSPGHSPGKISVGGDYIQAPTGTLRVEIGGLNKGQFDLLAVGGHAYLDGALQLVRLNNFNLHRGDKVTFLTAGGGVSGEFASVYGDFGGSTIQYEKNSVSVTLPTYSDIASTYGFTRNQTAVSHSLDSLSYDRNTKLFNFLDNRPVSKLPGDLDKIANEEITSVFTLGKSLAQVQSGNIGRRTDDIRSGTSGFSAAGLAINGSGPSYSGGFRTGVAGPNGNGLRDDGKDVKETKSVVAPEENRWGAFLSGTGEWVSVGNTDNARGYDLTSGGFTLGVDYKVTPNLAIGIAAGYTGTTADLVDGGRIRVNGGKIGIYGTYFQTQPEAGPVTMSKDSSKDSKEVQAPSVNVAKGFYADVAVFGGYNGYDTRRSALQGEARGDTDGGELNVLVGAGYDFKVGGLTFGPTASFNYTYIGTNGYNENGSLAPLAVHGGEADSLRTAFGFKASYDWKCGSVLIKPEVRAAWQHEFGDTAYQLTSDFGTGGDSFTVNGPQLGRDSALVGAGFAVQFNERFTTYFYYDGELGRKTYESHAVTGGIRVSF